MYERSATAEPGSQEASPEAPAFALSIVVPVYNEEANILPLYEGLVAALGRIGGTSEIVVVDDGSTDDTYARLAELAFSDPRLKVIRLRRNFGQTAAIAAGFDHASGAVIVPMDGDLQNDPDDIPRLLAKLDEGYDVVSGWRVKRAERSLLRTVPSRLANWLIGRVTGVPLHDYGCTLKAYRLEIVRDTRLYGEMHRFLPALANLVGARIAELPVNHRPRLHGESKYGLKRTFKVVLDLVTLKFLSYSTKPIYVFGGGGLLLCFGGFLAGLETLYMKHFQHVYVHRNPFILIAVLLFSLGINFILMGLLAELVIRTYHESQSKPTYWIRESVNVPAPRVEP
jgi:glycosyltransferase involved in cell wall biosynthesis